jgi:hypothetical protein
MDARRVFGVLEVCEGEVGEEDEEEEEQRAWCWGDCGRCERAMAGLCIFGNYYLFIYFFAFGACLLACLLACLGPCRG